MTLPLASRVVPLGTCFVLAASLASSARAGQSTPVATLRTEVRLLQEGRLASYYALLSPTFRETCSFSRFQPTGRQEEQQLHGAAVRVIGDRISGSKASLTYEFVRNGTVLGKATGDLYVRVGGKWFDEVDKYTTC